MMRGTVYVSDSDGVLRVREVRTFKVYCVADFKRWAYEAYGILYTLEFGPIGPPWRQG